MKHFLSLLMLALIIFSTPAFATQYINTVNANTNISIGNNNELFVDNVNDRVGIGTASPGQKLEVNGNVKVGDNIIVEGYTNYKVYENLASLDNYGGSAGSIVIDTSVPFTAQNMFTISIHGYDYNGNGPWDITVAAYAGEGSIYSARYVSLNRAGFGAPIIARNSTSGNVAIILGTNSSTYPYQITVTRFTQGFQNRAESYADGWTITPKTIVSGYDYQTTCADKSILTGLIQSTATGTNYITGGNVGIGTTGPVSALNVAGTTALYWGGTGNAYGLVTVGTAATGGSLFVQTPSLSTTYHSGLGVTGSYGTPAQRSVVNVNAYGVYSSGGYGSDLAFSTTLGTALNERMRIDMNGNVGIGTTGPLAKLSVMGTGAYGTPTYTPIPTTDTMIYSSEMTDNNYHSILQLLSVRQSLTTGSGANGYLGFSTMDDSNAEGIVDAGRIAIVNENGQLRNSATALSFWTNPGGVYNTAGTEKMRITSAGNVGIGTTSPGYKLTVYEAAANGVDIYGTNARFSVAIGVPGTRVLYIGQDTIENMVVFGHHAASGGFSWYSHDGSAWGERMRIHTNGKVGIGTTSPTEKLEVNGNILNNGGSYFRINGTGTGAGYYQVVNTGGNTIFGTNGNTGGLLTGSEAYAGVLRTFGATSLNFGTNDAVRMVINGSTGNVGIGTTTPQNTLNVIGAINGTGQIYGSVINAVTGNVNLMPAGAWTTGAYELTTTDNGAGNFGIYGYTKGALFTINGTSGNVGIGTTAPTAKLHINDSTSGGGVNFLVQDASNYGVYISSENSINYNYGLASDTGGWINYAGYGNALNQFRDLTIGNGKGVAVAMFDGSTGNVGIGVAPSYKLDVAGTVHATGAATFDSTISATTGTFNGGALMVTNPSAGSTITLQTTLTGATQNIFTVGNTGSGQNDAYMQLLDNGVTKVIIAANNARGGNTYFNGGGSVGIGNAAPNSTLHVTGTTNITSTLYAGGAITTAGQFTGPGTGLTGTAASLTVGDLSCTDCIGDTEISTNAGTSLAADLEEETHASEHDGTGLSASGETLNIDYGATAGTAVQGNTQITITAAGINTGGGTLTLGSGGTLTITGTEVDGSISNELQNIFQTISTTSGTAPVADTTTDTLTLTAGTALTITGDSTTDTVTIGVTANSIGDTQLAYDTGQALTTSSSPSFSDLTLSGTDLDLVRGDTSKIHRVGKISFDWTSGGTYDSETYNGIASTDNAGSMGDSMSFNSYNDITMRLDSNNNNGNSYFRVTDHSTGAGNNLFYVESPTGNAVVTGGIKFGGTSASPAVYSTERQIWGSSNTGTSTYYAKIYSNTALGAARTLHFLLRSESYSEYSADVTIHIPQYSGYSYSGYGSANSGNGPQIEISTGGLTTQALSLVSIIEANDDSSSSPYTELWLKITPPNAATNIYIQEFADSTEPTLLTIDDGSITWTTSAPANQQREYLFVQGAKNIDNSLIIGRGSVTVIVG